MHLTYVFCLLSSSTTALTYDEIFSHDVVLLRIRTYTLLDGYLFLCVILATRNLDCFYAQYLPFSLLQRTCTLVHSFTMAFRARKFLRVPDLSKMTTGLPKEHEALNYFLFSLAPNITAIFLYDIFHDTVLVTVTFTYGKHWGTTNRKVSRANNSHFRPLHSVYFQSIRRCCSSCFCSCDRYARTSFHVIRFHRIPLRSLSFSRFDIIVTPRILVVRRFDQALFCCLCLTHVLEFRHPSRWSPWFSSIEIPRWNKYEPGEEIILVSNRSDVHGMRSMCIFLQKNLYRRTVSFAVASLPKIFHWKKVTSDIFYMLEHISYKFCFIEF